MRPRFKARLLAALLLAFVFIACRKDELHPGITTTNQSDKHITFESLLWVFEKDTNLATAKIEIPDSHSYSITNIKMLVGTGAEPFHVPIIIPEFIKDTTQTLFYTVKDRQITISKIYDGPNFWDQLPKKDPADTSVTAGDIYYIFFVVQQIGFSKVEVKFG